MPRVPQLGIQQVQQSAPNIRRQPSARLQFDESSAQNAIAKNQAASANLLNTAVRIEAEERQKADKLAVLEADKRLSEIENKMLYDRQSGAMTRRGKDAFGLPDTVLPEYDATVDQISGSLANDNQINAFKASAISRRKSVTGQLYRHMSKEGMRYDEQTTQSYIATEKNAALENFHDGERIQQSLDRQVAAYNDYADRNGVDKKTRSLGVKQVKSSTHSGIVQRLLDGGDDLNAKSHYEKNKKDITGEDQVKISKLLDAGSLRGESQRQSDQIWESTNQDLGASIAKAEKINDPKLRDETVKRIRQKQNLKSASIKAAQDSNYMTASEYVKANPGLDPQEAMPISAWESLTLQQQSTLKKYGNNPSNNSKKWLAFLDKSPTELANMDVADFEQKYWAHFDSSHRTRAERMWKDASEGTTSPKVTNTITFANRVDSSLRRSEIIDPNKRKSKFTEKEAKLYDEFELQASRAVEEFELEKLGGKRKATGQEMQGVIDELLINKVFIDNNWIFSDDEAPAVLVKEEDLDKVYVPMKEIPPGEIERIRNIIRSSGYKVTDDKIERMYGSALVKDRKRFDAIMEE